MGHFLLHAGYSNGLGSGDTLTLPCDVQGLETFPHAVSLAALRAARSVANGAADSPERGVSRRWRWVLAGGRPALPCSPPSKSLVPSEDPPSSTDEGDPSASADEPQPEAASALYFTGHRDGRVRVWDMAAEVPGLLATVPFDAGGAGSKLRSVSTIQVPPQRRNHLPHAA